MSVHRRTGAGEADGLADRWSGGGRAVQGTARVVGCGRAAVRRLALLTAVVIALSLPAAGTHVFAKPASESVSVAGLPGRAIPGQYVVELDRGEDVVAATTRAENGYGATVQHVYTSALHGYSARMTQTQARALANAPGIASVQADTVFHVAAQSLPTGINRANADRSPLAAIDHLDRRVDVDVAVIDTGVDLNHPDLNVFRAGAHNCSGAGLSAQDQNGHGTHVAGTIGALDNRIGVVGMAPGARIWPVRVLDATGSGTAADLICGIDYVTRHAHQIEVANMSMGGPGADDGNCGRTNGDALHQAICASVAAGVTYVVAAGNSSSNAALSIPAAYNEVITVSALADFNGSPGGGARATCRRDVDDTFANFSNFGPDVDLIAPGVCIRSTWIGGRYATLSGTSMAAPHVTGAAALYLDTHPAATPSAVRHALRAAGSRAWNNVDDPDAIKEPVVTVAHF